MPFLNRVILAGHITRDIELKYTPGGLAVASFGLAISKKWTSKDGEKKEDVCFVDLNAFGKTAESVGQYFSKGSPIFIEGSLKLDQWEDKDGQKRSRLKVVVDSFQFIGSKSDGEGKGGAKKLTVKPTPDDMPEEEIPF